MNVIQLPETRNETMMTCWKDCIFSENIYAWFEYGLQPVFSNKMEDLMLPKDYVLQAGEEGEYKLFGWSDEAGEHLYTGRLFAPKGIKLI
jgi:hypothetical protein